MSAPLISVVIPTVRGREESLERTVAAYEATCENAELIIVRDKEACGIAWQEGAELATGDYVHFSADDLVPLAGWAEAALEATGVVTPAPVVLEPDGRLQSCGGFGFEPHREWLPDGTEVEWTTVPFLSRDQWEIVDPMIPVHYCTDVWVSWRLAWAGIPTVLRTGYRFVHHNEMPGRGAGMEIHARNRADRAFFADACREVLAA